MMHTDWLIDPTPDARVWRGEGWEIREGRWQDSLPARVDHVISDPPYDARTHAGGRRGKGWNGKQEDKREIYETAPIGFDPITPSSIVLPLVALADRWVVCFCAVEQLGAYQDAAGDFYVRAGLWRKRGPTPQFTGDRPGTFGDGIACMHSASPKRWNGGGHTLDLEWMGEPHAFVIEHGVANESYAKEDRRVHETQKPIGLMSELVELFTEPGDLVWDPYSGSGMTGAACIETGRAFIGHEMQAHHAENAALRLGLAEQGMRLKDVPLASISQRVQELAAAQLGLFDVKQVAPLERHG